MDETFTDRFRAMGTEISVMVVGSDPTLLRIARDRIADLEQRWSRFLPTSEVSRLNDAAGAPVHLSTETLTLLSRARDGFDITRGRFDPFQLRALEALGYRSSFASMGRPEIQPLLAQPRTRSTPLVQIDQAASSAELPVGIGFDPGGIGKGLAADLVAEELMTRGADGVCINLGGDLRVAGRPAGHDSWTISVRDGADDDPCGHLSILEGAVATTSRSRRRWTGADGLEYHHVIDPATGRSATTRAVHATAVASMGWQAEVLSTVAFLDGAAGIALAEELGATALVATEDRVVVGPSWARFARPIEVAA